MGSGWRSHQGKVLGWEQVSIQGTERQPRSSVHDGQSQVTQGLWSLERSWGSTLVRAEPPTISNRANRAVWAPMGSPAGCGEPRLQTARGKASVGVSGVQATTGLTRLPAEDGLAVMYPGANPPHFPPGLDEGGEGKSGVKDASGSRSEQLGTGVSFREMGHGPGGRSPTGEKTAHSTATESPLN